MVFSADDRVLIKLLKQYKGYGAKNFNAKFSCKQWTLSRLNKLFVRLLNTGHFTFGGISQKPVSNVCVGKFN